MRQRRAPSPSKRFARETLRKGGLRAAIAAAVAEAFAGGSHTLVGELKPWAGSGASDPSEKWMLCNGRPVSRTEYAELFAAIGTNYGAGDGSTTFNIPDFRGRVLVGSNLAANLGGKNTALSDRGRHHVGGTEDHTLSIAEMPSHDHGDAESSGAHSHTVRHERATNTTTGGTAMRVPDLAAPTSTEHSRLTTTDGAHTHNIPHQGGGASHNNMQPFGVAHYLIRVKP